MYKVVWEDNKAKLCSKDFSNYDEAELFINILNVSRVRLEVTPSGEGWSEEAYDKACRRKIKS